MRKTLFAVVLISALAASGCAHRRASVPDEFAVARNAPLVIPPDYTLTPPKPGTVTASPQESQQQAIDALFGGPAPRPLSESSLLDEAGRDRAALGVRSIAGDPKTEVVDMGETTRTIIAAPQADSDIASAQVP